MLRNLRALQPIVGRLRILDVNLVNIGGDIHVLAVKDRAGLGRRLFGLRLGQPPEPLLGFSEGLRELVRDVSRLICHSGWARSFFNGRRGWTERLALLLTSLSLRLLLLLNTEHLSNFKNYFTLN